MPRPRRRVAPGRLSFLQRTSLKPHSPRPKSRGDFLCAAQVREEFEIAFAAADGAFGEGGERESFKAIERGERFASNDAVELLKLMETYEPADLNDLLARIPHWQQVLRQEINEGSGTRPFFNERVEELHGGGRDQRRRDNTRLTAKENERAFLERLQCVLATQAKAVELKGCE